MAMIKVMQWLVTVALILGGFLLLCTPSPAQTKIGFAPTRFTVVDDGTVGKPDVVLVPGLTSSRDVWTAEAKLLAPNYRLHLLQLNGFAGQPAGPNATGEILPSLVEEMHVYCAGLKTRPVVIGHSLGGLLTLMLADKYPADVTKIVIVDAFPFFGMTFGPQVTAAMVKPQAEQMRDMLAKLDADQRKTNAEKTAEKLVLNPEARKLVAKNSADSDGHVMGEAMFEDLQADLRPELASIKVQTLMLYPFDATLTRDGETPKPEMVDALYQGAYKPMPNATAVRVDASRHFIMLDQPEKFDQLVERFLRQ